MQFSRAREVAVEAAKVGGEILLSYYQKGSYSTHIKEDTSLQTAADLAAERAMIACVQAEFPDYAIESEEQGLSNEGKSPYLWHIDPLDGTENFVLGLPYFSSTVTLCYAGQPQLAVVYEPIARNLYTAERRQGARLNGERIRVSRTSEFKHCRAFFIPDFVTKRQPFAANLRQELYMHCRRVLDTWSPALDWCLVASGRADLVVALAGEPILPDAGTLILEEAGGQITDFFGQVFDDRPQRYLIGSNGTKLHEQFLQLLANAFWERESCQEMSH